MSFNIGLSGLRTTNQSLNTISHNIANVSTAGFKAGRAEFAAVYSGGRPGGVELANVSQDFDADGAVEYTGRALDMAISGRGFFVVSQGGQTAYTRAGTFSSDADNYIITATGARLQGYLVDGDNNLTPGVIGDLRVNTGTLEANATTRYEFGANLKADLPAIDITAADYAFDPEKTATYHFSYSGRVYNSLGAEHVLNQYFVKTDENSWRVHYSIDGVVLSGTSDLTFTSDGKLARPAGGDRVLTHTVTHTPTTGAAELSVEISYGETFDAATPEDFNPAGQLMRQFAGDFAVSRNEANGYGAGELAGIRVESDGSLYAVYTNNQSLLQGRVILADFNNPNGLTTGDNTTWYQSFASGAANIGAPETGALGTLTTGAYEGSNVELTGELVNLMTAQRNYQANAKSISTADQMTKVLFNTI